MPPSVVKTVRELIFWQYAKIVSESAGLGKKNYGMIMSTYKKLSSGDISWSSTVREWVKEREQRGICIYCGETDKLTTDHILPRICSGKDVPDNVVSVCKSCNSSKGSKGLYEWRGLDVKDNHHRIAEGKYLKYLYALHEKQGTLYADLDELCKICGLVKKCIEEGHKGKLTVYCIEGCFLRRTAADKYVNPFSNNSERFAQECDAATIAKDAKKLNILITQALENINSCDIASQAQIYYSIGTIFGVIADLSENPDDESLIKKQLYYLRKSISLIESEKLSKTEYRPYVLDFKSNLHTNYANALDRIGRKIAAIEQYKKVLSLNPKFGMALGNLGEAYQHYGMLVSDPTHKSILYNCALTLLSNAVDSDDPNTYSEAKEYFKNCMQQYSPEYVKNVLSTPLTFPQYNYKTKSELAYRTWVLQNGLFLNPLNDLPYNEFCFAADVLQLPNIIVEIDAKPIYHGMLNQLKQEYIFSRYQYYCALQVPSKPHFADKDTYLLNSFDYPQYSIRIEQMKCSFRLLYSLLDKVAFFINSYYELGIIDRDVSFSSIWRSEKAGKNPYKYKNILNPKDNYALASLYWISKDFYVKFVESPNPQAKRISEIRHAFEHRYAKICWMDLVSDEVIDKVDNLALYISEIELTVETSRLLKLIREAIICLVLAVGIEEAKKQNNSSNKIIPKIPLYVYDDEWKI